MYLSLLPNCRQKITSPIVAHAPCCRLVLSSATDAQWDLQSGVRAGREHSAEIFFSQIVLAIPQGGHATCFLGGEVVCENVTHLLLMT